MSLLDRIKQTAEFLENRFQQKNPVGIVLGTGLGELANEIEDSIVIDYIDIPNFPKSTVEGHDGKLIYGKLNGVEVLAMKGRFHFYEGYSMDEVVFPIRVMHFLNVDKLLLSNASGGMNPTFKVGDLMILRDQINLFPTNPLMGPNIEELGPRFPDMSEPYDNGMIRLLKDSANDLGYELHTGVYAGVSGPCFETPAEYKSLRIIGGDAVGMSTVPENIAAKHMGMKVAALSVITDLGVEGIVETVSHEEVQMAAQNAEPKLASIVKDFLPKLTAT
jgi:purine-nucleoside phosphorylase